MATAQFHGNMTRDPEMSYHKVTRQDGSEEQRTLAKFSIAESTRKRVNGEWTDGEPNYFDFVAWGREADHISASCPKGTRVVINASVNQNKWKTPEGDNRSRVEFEVDTIGPSLQFAETPTIVKTNGPAKETVTESTNTEDF